MSDSADSPVIDLSSVFPLRQSRAHEVCGAGAFVFATILAGMSAGPVIWISQSHLPESLHPEGMAAFCDPSRLIFSKGKTHIDSLWMAEEALRSGATPFVVTLLDQQIGLTEGRRLQLASEAGKSTGLFILPEGMGSNAAETRWRCNPHFDANFAIADSTLHRWQIIKNKSGTLGDWVVRWDEQARRVIVVSKLGQRQVPARAHD